MIRRTLLLTCLAAACFLQLGCNAHGAAYIVRHADRDGGLDQLKVPEGTDRAEALADLLDSAEIAAVFSTDTVRTRSTAQPLATRLGLGITIYSTPSEVAAQVRGPYDGKIVLIVGHSNTVAQIVTALGAELPNTLPLDPSGNIHHDDFDNLELVVIDDEGDAGAVHTTYGAATPPP